MWAFSKYCVQFSVTVRCGRGARRLPETTPGPVLVTQCVTMTGYGSVGTDPRSDANVVSGNRDCADPRGARGANGNCSVTYFLDPTGSIALTLSNELWQMSQLCFSKRKIRRRNRDSGGGLLLLRGRLHRQNPLLHSRQTLRQRQRVRKEP